MSKLNHIKNSGIVIISEGLISHRLLISQFQMNRFDNMYRFLPFRIKKKGRNLIYLRVNYKKFLIAIICNIVIFSVLD